MFFIRSLIMLIRKKKNMFVKLKTKDLHCSHVMPYSIIKISRSTHKWFQCKRCTSEIHLLWCIPTSWPDNHTFYFHKLPRPHCVIFNWTTNWFFTKTQAKPQVRKQRALQSADMSSNSSLIKNLHNDVIIIAFTVCSYWCFWKALITVPINSWDIWLYSC